MARTGSTRLAGANVGVDCWVETTFENRSLPFSGLADTDDAVATTAANTVSNITGRCMAHFRPKRTEPVSSFSSSFHSLHRRAPEMDRTLVISFEDVPRKIN